MILVRHVLGHVQNRVCSGFGMEHLSDLLIKFASIPVILVCIYALFVFRELGSELRIFTYFLFLSGIIELFSKILWFQSVNNLPLLHIYVAVGFVLQVWFYHSVLKGFINPNVIWGVAGLFTIFTIVNSIFIQPIDTFNSNATTVQSILILIFSLSTYLLMLNDIVREKRVNLLGSLNWINSGLFVYYASSLLIFYFSNTIFSYFSATANKYLWSVHALFLVVMNLCFFIGLWKRPTK